MTPSESAEEDVEGVSVGRANGQGFAELARLLVEESIVGVVRGRAEFGPRALGHRSS